VEAIRVALEYAQTSAAGREVKEVPTDADDFAAHLQDEGRRRTLRKSRRKTKAVPGDLQVLRQHSVLRGYLN
jgi:hypothetical protein